MDNVRDNLQGMLGASQTSQEVEIEAENCFTTVENATERIDTDTELKKQNVLDRKLNREQRERIAKKIFWMMVWEVAVIGILLLGLFCVPFLNALGPQITINLPPVFLTLSIIIGYLFLVRYIDFLPDIYISWKKIKLPKTKIKTNVLIKALFIISFFVFINILPRKSYIFIIEQIQLSSDIIKLILWTSLAVFTKTTILGKAIIKTLYELMKQHNLN